MAEPFSFIDTYGPAIPDEEDASIRGYGPAGEDIVSTPGNETPPPQGFSFINEYGPAIPDETEAQIATPVEEDPTWEDYGRQIMSGGAQIAGGLGWVLEKLGAETVGGAIRERSMRSADQWVNSKLDEIGLDQKGLSPQARQAMQADFLGESAFSDKWDKAKLMTAGSLLGTMAGLGAGKIFTAGLAKAGLRAATGAASKTAATIGYGAGEAAVAAPSAGVATEEEIKKMSHEQLMDSLEYQAILDGLDMPEKEARAEAKKILAKAAGGDAAAMTLVSTFVLSSPFGNKLEDILSGVVGAAKGRVGAAAQGAATEATQEFLQSGAEQLSQNVALKEAQPNRSYMQDVLESAVGGAAAGGLMGGTLGGFTGPVSTEENANTPPGSENPSQNAIDEIERIQAEAEQRALEQGGDNLDAALAGAQAASEAGTEAQTIFEEAAHRQLTEAEFYNLAKTPAIERARERAGESATTETPSAPLVAKAANRQLTEQEYNELARTPAAKRTPARKVAREKLIPEEEFNKAEEADTAAREAAQAEAGKRYERQQRAAAAVPAEKQRAEQKQQQVKEAEYQRELQKGAEPQTPANPLMEERMKRALEKSEAQKAAKAKIEERRAAAKAKAATEIETAKQNALKGLPNLTPDVVVNRQGEAVTREQMAAERERAQVDAAKGEIPLKPSEINLERRVGNLKIALETPEGVERTGKRPNGTTWRTKMKGVDYGFVRGTEGADREQIDAFVNTSSDANYDTAFVVDQLNQETGKFDEHKVMLGFKNQAAAVRAYKQQFDKGWKVGKVTPMSQNELESWAKGGKQHTPVVPASETAPPSPGSTTTPVVSPEDIEAIRTRQQRKGRRKPKVMYRLPEGHSITLTEEEPIPGVPGTEMTVEANDAEGNVVGGVTAEVNDSAKEIKVSLSKVDEDLQGQGIGLEMYNALLQEAYKRGYKLTSDFSVSEAAQRVYAALERRGAKVTRNPNAKLNERGGLVSDTTRNPVLTVEPIDIRLRTEDLEGTAPAAPDTLTDIIDTAEGVMAAMPGLQGKIILDPLELPTELYEQMRDDGQLGAKGLFDVDTGNIYIFAANHTSAVDVIRTILHEGVAHKGLRVILGDKLPGLLQDIWQNGDQAAIQRIADKYGLDTNDATDRMKATEEYVAHLAERTPNAPILQRITDFIRQFLRRIGALKDWTDSDIHALLRDVKREMQGKPLNKITFTEDVKVEETGEVVQVEERADKMLSQMDKRTSIVEKLKGCLAA